VGYTQLGLQYLGENLTRATQYDQLMAQQHAAQAYQQRAAEWDRQWEASHKSELQNKAYASKVSQEIVSLLRENGLSDQEIMEGWHQGTGRAAKIRQPLAQAAMWSHAKQRLAAKNMREGRRNPVPEVQRPGVGRAPENRADRSVR